MSIANKALELSVKNKRLALPESIKARIEENSGRLVVIFEDGSKLFCCNDVFAADNTVVDNGKFNMVHSFFAVSEQLALNENCIFIKDDDDWMVASDNGNIKWSSIEKDYCLFDLSCGLQYKVSVFEGLACDLKSFKKTLQRRERYIGIISGTVKRVTHGEVDRFAITDHGVVSYVPACFEGKEITVLVSIVDENY